MSVPNPHRDHVTPQHCHCSSKPHVSQVQFHPIETQNEMPKHLPPTKPGKLLAQNKGFFQMKDLQSSAKKK